MRPMPQTLSTLSVCRRPLLALAVLATLAGCGVNGDFGEVNPTLVRDDIHDWVGRDDKKGRPISPSAFELTDDERQLRDLAYPLLEPPYNRQKFHSVASEYGLTPQILREGAYTTAYFDHLMAERVRSPAARYAQLTDDIRNDSTRLPQFFETAGRVFDLDRKREQSLAYVKFLTPQERTNTLNRIRENTRTVERVRVSLKHRVAGYRYALERMVIMAPSKDAVPAEQALNRLGNEVAYFRNNTMPPYALQPSLAFQR